MRWMLLLVGLVGCAVPGADEQESETTSGLGAGVRIETHFTNPTKHDGHDTEILDELVRLIDATDEGDSIDAAIHSISVNAVVKAFERAKGRKVKIRVAHNGEDFRSDDTSPKDLAKILGKDSHRFCGNVESKGGNVGGCIADGASSIMHSKLVLFSRTKDANKNPQKNVVWFGSANMTNQTGANTFNNTVTVYGDETLYSKFESEYFERLWKQTHSTPDAISSTASHVTAFASPHSQNDLILARLAPIQANTSCEIRVSEAMLHEERMVLVDRLIELKKGKCLVKVIGTDNGKELDAAVVRKLDAANIPLKKAHIHDKLILVKAKYDGEAGRKIVFTGSHNWTKSANDRNDELFVKIETDEVYKAFEDHFEDTWKAGK